VRDAESLVRRMVEPAKPASDGAEVAIDPNIQRLEDELAEKLGAKVTIQHSAFGTGKLLVSYNSLDELDGILAHIR
jgi:ParB family chromosome partitioning protein